MRRLSILFVVTIVAIWNAAALAAQQERVLRVYTASERDAIRAMPIESRPNRVGHFYGNTVRRLNRIGF